MTVEQDMMDRFTTLQKQQPWMSQQAASSLSASGLSTQDMLNKAEQLRQVAVQADFQVQGSQSWKAFFHDPVLQKHPTAMLAFKDYVTGALGAEPIVRQSLQAQQQALQKEGFGTGLPTDGVWSPEWTTATRNAGQKVINDQLHGIHPGSTSLGKVMDAMGSFNPVPAGNAALGTLKGLWGGLKQVAGDVAGGLGGVVHNFEDPLGLQGHQAALKAIEGPEQATRHALGDTSYQASKDPAIGFRGGIGTFAGRGLGDAATIGTLLGVTSVGVGAVTKGASALGFGEAGANAAESVPEAEAMNAGGVVSQTADTTSAPGRFQRVMGAAGESADRTSGAFRGPGVIAKTTAQPFLEHVANVAEHIPVLGNTGPWVDATTGVSKVATGIDQFMDEGGLYYRARRIAALPYDFKPVAAVGNTAGKIMVRGAEARGVAAASTALTGNNNEATSAWAKGVQDTHILDTANAAVTAQFKGTALGSIVNLNNLAFLVHPNVQPGMLGAATAAGPSKTVIGHDVTTLSSALQHALVVPGWAGLHQAATGIKMKALTAVLGEDGAAKYLSDTIAKHASYAQAEQDVNGKILADGGLSGVPIVGDMRQLTDADKETVGRVLGMDLPKVTQLMDRASEIRNDPKLLAQAEDNLLAQRGGEEFQLRVKRDMLNQRRYVEAQGGTWRQGGLGNAKDYMDAQNVVRDQLDQYVGQPGVFVNAPSATQNYGIARADTLGEQDVYNEVAHLQNELDANPAMENDPDWLTRARALGMTMGVDSHYLAQKGSDLLASYKQYASSLLSSNMHLEEDAPQAAKNAVADLADRGYKLVAGRDIGHIHTGDHVLDDFGPTLKARRKIANAIGINPSLANSQDVAAERMLAIENKLRDRVAAGKIVLTPGTSVGSIMSQLSAHDILPANLNLRGHLYQMFQHKAQTLSDLAPDERTLAQDMLDRGVVTEESDAVRLAQMDSANEATRYMGVANTKWKDVRELLLNPEMARKGNRVQAEETAKAAGLSETKEVRDALGFKPTPPGDYETPAEGAAREAANVEGAKQVAAKQATLAAKPGEPRVTLYRGEPPTGTPAKLTGLPGDLDKTGRWFTKDRAAAEQYANGGTVKAVDVPSSVAHASETAGGHVLPPEYAAAATPSRMVTTTTPRELGLVSDEASAREVLQAVRDGSANVPSSLLGLSRLEDMFRAKSLGWAGKGIMGSPIAGRVAAGALVGGAAGMVVNPDAVFKGDLSNVETGAAAGAAGGLAFKNLGWSMANLPSNLLRLRNEWRFDLSPTFALRRFIKDRAKLAIYSDTPIPLSPVNAMRKAGTLESSRASLEAAMPEYDSRLRGMDNYADDAEQYLRSGDILHINNHRNLEAYVAGKMADDGASPSQIRDTLVKALGYGTRDENGVMQTGRSALERSANTLFFPFSFDKTLYKAFGSHLIDNPAQRLLVTAGLGAYNQMDPNMIGSSDWVKKHLPMLKEVQRLNAFSSGISPGQFGGINLPLLQLFLPQSWKPSHSTNALLQEFIPAVKDFHRIFQSVSGQQSEFSQQYSIAKAELTGKGPAETPAAQLDQAFQLRDQYDKQWSKYIMYNHGKQKVDQLKFAIDPAYGALSGAPITKASVNQLVQEKYPAFQANKGAEVAAQHLGEWQQFVNSLGGPAASKDGAALQTFYDNATKLGKAISESAMLSPGQNGYHDPSELAYLSQYLRKQAITWAKTSPAFYKLYPKVFGSILGPLEAQ